MLTCHFVALVLVRLFICCGLVALSCFHCLLAVLCLLDWKFCLFVVLFLFCLVIGFWFLDVLLDFFFCVLCLFRLFSVVRSFFIVFIFDSERAVDVIVSSVLLSETSYFLDGAVFFLDVFC